MEHEKMIDLLDMLSDRFPDEFVTIEWAYRKYPHSEKNEIVCKVYTEVIGPSDDFDTFAACEKYVDMIISNKGE